MPKNSNQKLKLWYVYKILNENTDENNPMTMNEIISALKAYNITAERKSIYDDIELLINSGVDIVSEKRDKFVYYIADRDFQVAELKILIDCIQSSKFITVKKSAELITKLEKLASRYQAQDLHRYVYVNNRVKAVNERIYYNIDYLSKAIGKQRQISFKYYQYSTKKLKRYKNNEMPYIVSPYVLVYSDDNYYLLAHYPKYDGITHFRVDKMEDIFITDDPIDAVDKTTDKNFSITEYTKQVFGMYKGKTETIKLECDEAILSVVIEKFGEDIFLRHTNGSKFIATVKADVSPTFYSWVFMLGKNIKILYPQNIIDEFKDTVKDILNLY